MRHTLKGITAVCCIALLSACKPATEDDFDRKALLSNVYANVIIPQFQNFQVSAVALKASADAFVLSPDAAKLDTLKEDFLNAYKAFQAVEVYTFTPSMDLNTALNSFPPDTVQINTNILSGSYNLSAVNNIRAKGFPAIDFLLFAKSQSETISTFAQPNNRQYLSDIVQEILSKTSLASSGWGNFESDFVNASGTDVGSSVGMLVNDISYEMERNRRERVGNSLGYVGSISSGVLSPYSVEAYFSKQSKALLLENLIKSKLLFTGGTGTGFDDYLNSINAIYDSQPLATAISNQFDLVIQSAQNVPSEFSQSVNTNKQQMETLFLELKKLTVMIKVDMSSQLGVVINYSDNDGD